MNDSSEPRHSEFVQVPTKLLFPIGPSGPGLKVWMMVSAFSKNNVCSLSAYDLALYCDFPHGVFNEAVEELLEERLLVAWRVDGGDRWCAIYPDHFGEVDQNGVGVRVVKKIKSSAVRRDVWSKSDGSCWYCGRKTIPFDTFAIDHFIPQSKGGPDEVWNYVPSCRGCNTRKRDKSVEDFRDSVANTNPRPHWASEGPVLFWFERRNS